MTNRNKRLIDDMGTLARSLDNLAAAYRLAGDGLLARECELVAYDARRALSALRCL